MIVSATHRNARVSAQKARLYRPLVKGLRAQAAVMQLAYMPGKVPRLIGAVLRSAMANATNNGGVQVESLLVHDVVINSGFSLKRARAVSRGSSHPITKRTAHITVMVEGQATEKPKAATRLKKALAAPVAKVKAVAKRPEKIVPQRAAIKPTQPKIHRRKSV